MAYLEISRAHNEEWDLGEFDIQRQEGERKAANNLPNKFLLAKQGLRGIKKKRKKTLLREIVEKHDCQCHERTIHREYGLFYKSPVFLMSYNKPKIK